MGGCVCTFFGHRDCDPDVKTKLEDKIQDLIHQGVDTFYVGDKGLFDAYVRNVLKSIQMRYPQIRYAVVLATMPSGKNEQDYSDTIFPEGIELGPQRFAIDRRNKWMLNKAEHVVCYVRHSWGGAYKYSRLAWRQGKCVYNLCDEHVDFD